MGGAVVMERGEGCFGGQRVGGGASAAVSSTQERQRRQQTALSGACTHTHHEAMMPTSKLNLHCCLHCSATAAAAVTVAADGDCVLVPA